MRMSPSKLKPITDLVRGKDLNEALNILKFTPGKGSEIVEKVVDDYMQKYKDEIIEKAAEILAKRVQRTKKAKEALNG